MHWFFTGLIAMKLSRPTFGNTRIVYDDLVICGILFLLVTGAVQEDIISE